MGSPRKTNKTSARALDPVRDPFGERAVLRARGPLQLLGGRFCFESNSRQLLSLVDHAFAGLPRHILTSGTPGMRVRLVLTPAASPRVSLRRGRNADQGARPEPPPLAMHAGSGLLGGATAGSSLVIASPGDRSALVAISADMLKFQYHARYELIEFAVYMLAARVQGCVPMHAACVGQGRRGVLLMGASGAGKSTVALQSLLLGLDFLAEDSVLVTPGTLLASGIANFLHVRSESLRWVEPGPIAADIRNSPLIRRRSGVRKFEVDLRRGHFSLSASALKIEAIVFLSARSAGRAPLLTALSRREAVRKLTATQAYAANQPNWDTFVRSVGRIAAFELRRGSHPRESAEALRLLLRARRR